jgi:hypothetical protein
MYVFNALAALAVLALPFVGPANAQTCGQVYIKPCPKGYVCQYPDKCKGIRTCLGDCVRVPEKVTSTAKPKPTPTPPAPKPIEYQSCGGFRIEQVECPEGYVCMDDPRKSGCGMACDEPGICVEDTICGGFAGLRCPEGKQCYDFPNDPCDPNRGGFDCGGICI